MLTIDNIVQDGKRYFKVVRTADVHLNVDEPVYIFQECTKGGKLKNAETAFSISNIERKLSDGSLALLPSKAEKEAAKRAEKQAIKAAERAAKAAEWKANLEARKAAFIDALPEADRVDFLQAITPSTEPGSAAYPTDFVASIAYQFHGFGKLSDNQLSAFLRAYRAHQKFLVAKEGFRDYEVGQKVFFTVKLKSCEATSWAGHATSSYYSAPTIYGWKLRFITSTGQQVSFKTTDELVKDHFSKIEGEFDLVGKVKWVSDDKRYISISARGLDIGV